MDIKQHFYLSESEKQRCKLLHSVQRISASSEDKMFCISSKHSTEVRQWLNAKWLLR